MNRFVVLLAIGTCLIVQGIGCWFNAHLFAEDYANNFPVAWAPTGQEAAHRIFQATGALLVGVGVCSAAAAGNRLLRGEGKLDGDGFAEDLTACV